MMILRITFALLLIAQCSRSIPLDQFYPFGANEGDQELSSNSINTGTLRSVFFSNGFSFYNISMYYFHLSTNGLITMTSTGSLFHITPHPFPVFGIPYIAPYWFDNGFNSTGISSTVYYRETSNDFALLTRAKREIRVAFPNVGEFYPTNLLILTWSIGNSSIMDDVFQCVLASNDQLSFVMFYYADGLATIEQLEFEFEGSGSESELEGFELEESGFINSSNATVQAGINAGDGQFESIEIETDTSISSTSNVDIRGVWMYQTNERFIIQPNSSIFVEIIPVNSAVIGQSFALQCSATMVRGITGTVDFKWTTGNTQVRRINDVSPSDLVTLIMFNDSFVIPSLDISDIGRVYQCEVIMNSFLHTTVNDVFTVPFPVCPCSNDTVLDVVFVIDSSGSIGQDRFQLIRDFTGNIADDVVRRSPGSAVGVILFENSAHIQFDLQEHASLNTLLPAINTLPYSGGGTDTAEALTLLLSSAQNGALGLRTDSSNVAIVITDGFSNSRIATRFAAAKLHASNIFDVFAVGVGGASLTELQTIASSPDFVYFTSSFTSFGLQQLQERILQELCPQDQLSPHIYLQPSGLSQITVGQRQDVICSISMAADEDPDSIDLAWFNEEDIVTIDGRVTIVKSTNDSSNSNGSVITTVIQFDPLFEDDAGIYACYSTVNDSVKFNSIELQNFRMPVPRISFQPNGFLQGIVGEMQDIICSVTLTSEVDPESVELIWENASNIITSDNRVTITSTNITDNPFSFTYTTAIQFAYLMEGDEGSYTCRIVVDEMMESHSAILHNLRIPRPVIRVTSIEAAVFNESTTLECSAIAVRGITSRVDIIWTTGFIIARIVDGVTANTINNSAVYTDQFVTPPLSVNDDGRVYQCQVVINSNPRTVFFGSIVLDVLVPSCYVTTNCIGEPVDSALTFADCCTNVGVSYDLDGRCQPCPTKNCSGGAVKDVIFVIDTSSSIGFSRFQLIRELAENITTSIKVNSPESLFGLITFDDFARFQFNISRHTDLSTLLPAINPGMPYSRGYRTNTASALNFLRSGGRQNGFLRLRDNTSNIAIVITDGYSSSFSSLRSAAFSLHAANIFDVYALGIGSNIFSELQFIASDPSLVFSTSFLTSFTAQQLLENVIEHLCSTPAPRIFLRPDDLQQGIFGEMHELVCLVHLSTTVDPVTVDLEWNFISNDSSRITVIPTTITTDDMIGNTYTTVIQFAYLVEEDEGNYTCTLTVEDSVESSFDLEILNPIIAVQVTAANSPEINQPLILQCDATTLRGITNRVDIIWTTGGTQVRRSNDVVGRNGINSTVYNDSFVIPSLNLSDIGNIYQCKVLINSIVPTASIANFTIPIPGIRCSGNSVHDVVFVIDESGSIRSSRFQLIREFVGSISTEIIHNSPRSAIGVILFNDDAHIQFNVRAHASLSSLLSAINQLPYTSGGTDTAEALTLLLSSARNGALGLRTGSFNIAIVITDGFSNSQSATLSAAAALHASNIFDVFAVGVGGADLTELQAIASSPDFVYFTSSFTSFGLQQLQERIIEQLCDFSILSISLQPSGQYTVGQRQDVICSVSIPSDADPDTIELAWLNEQDIVTIDGRITIDESSDNFESNDTTLTTAIQFDPLTEDDEGEYICYTMINESFIFESIQLQNFRIPLPFVLITFENDTLSNLTIGDPLTLDCTVTAVRGISSSVNIIWTTGGRVVRHVNDTTAVMENDSAIYTDSFEISSLSAIDNERIYQCTVVVNSSPQVSRASQIMLNFPAPSCFNTTYCGGESLGNNSVTFDHCCFELLGTSFATPGQCLLCPKTDCTIDVVKDIVFVIDTTSSIGTFRFQIVREFVDNLTISLKLNSPESSVAVILFDNFARIQFTLGVHTSLKTLSSAINPGLPYLRGFSTDTAGALRLLLSSAQNGILGIRNDSSNIAIVITDGRSNYQFFTKSAAAALHAANIFDVYAIGYGSADINELNTIASDPHFVYFANFFDRFDIQQLQMNVSNQLCSLSVPRLSMEPSGFFSGIIGEMQDIICSVTVTSVVDPDSVKLTWTNASSIITSDNRVIITPTNVTANLHSFTYTTAIQFAYLMEGDKGTYICNVMVDEMMESHATKLQNLRIPTPTVRVTSIDTAEFGGTATLECNAIAARGITSRVDIIWTTGFITVKRVEGVTANTINNSAVYTDQFVTPPLSVNDDGKVYQCQVVINSNFSIRAFGNIVLDFIVPSCYVATNCNGGLINRSITFSDCCTSFGASFDFDGRCQPCPNTNCSGGAVRDVIFVIDTSSSIGYSRFQLVRELTENITTSIRVNSPESLFGLITFDYYATFQFNISRHTDLSTLLPAINPGIPYNRGYRTNTANALYFLRSGGRQNGFLRLRDNTSNVAIVITDGYSSSFSSLRSEAISLHAENIFDVYAVGIGSNRFSELQLIASNPSFVFSTSSLTSFTAQQLVEDVIEKLCSIPLPNIFLRPNGLPQGVIGQQQDLVCSVLLSSTVDPSTVVLTWNFASDDNRVTVIPTTITTDDGIGNVYTTVIQFAYLMEGDEGNYNCTLTVENSTESNLDLELAAPSAIVEVTTEDNIAFGESITLECNATVVRGVTSNLDFQWFVTNNGFVRRLVRSMTNVTGNPNNISTIYRDFLDLPALNASNRGDNYTCEVKISNSNINFLNTSASSLVLDYPIPSCYSSTNCNGNTIGSVSTTFFECCTSLSGVTFELERQCRMCPSSGCPFKPRDIVLVLDNSYAVRSYEFPLVRQFAESISINLKIGSPNSSVGVILFDTFAQIAFDLEEHSSLETLIPAINPGLPYSGRFYNPNIADALRLLLSSSLLNSTNEANTTSIAIVFTAGGSRSFSDTMNAAAQLHATNMYDVYAVGIDNYNFFDLRTIASDSSFFFAGSRYFSSFGVQRLQQFVLDQLCNVPPPIVTMSAPDEQTAGQSLTLECRIAAVKDIDSTVDIIWTTGSAEVRRVENIPACLISNYSDFFTIPVLSTNDNNTEYQCKVIINISPSVTGNNSITLNVTLPSINVTMHIPEEQIVGQSLTLECRIKSPKDNYYTFDIIWTKNYVTEVRSVKNVSGSLLSSYSDFYTVPVLRRTDEYASFRCDVIINFSQPANTSERSVLENVTQPAELSISPKQSPLRVNVGGHLPIYCTAVSGVPIPTIQWHSEGFPVIPTENSYQQVFVVPTDSPHTTMYTCVGVTRKYYRQTGLRDNEPTVYVLLQTEVRVNVTVIVEDSCPELQAPKRGKVTITEDGKLAFFSCNRGYTMRGSSILKCINGKWDYSPPNCRSISQFCRQRCNF